MDEILLEGKILWNEPSFEMSAIFHPVNGLKDRSCPVRNSIFAISGERSYITPYIYWRRYVGAASTGPAPHNGAGLYERDRWRRGRVRTSASDVPPSCRSITPTCTGSVCNAKQFLGYLCTTIVFRFSDR